MSPQPDPLPVTPFRHPVRGTVRLPGSKSLTNRALLLAALCDGPVTIANALFSEDTTLMATALAALGIEVHADPAARTIQVAGRGGEVPMPAADLWVGNAGTAARFLTAFVAAAPHGTYRLDGVAQMRRRPMQGLIAALRTLGVDLRCLREEGHLPLEIHARGLPGGAVTLDASESSQMLSALLMVAPLARQPLEVGLTGGVRWPFVQMTARLMEEFDQPPVAAIGPHRLRAGTLTPYRRPSGRYDIEPDATAASYFLALPLVTGGRLALPGLRRPGQGLQGDTAFQPVLEDLGLTISPLADGSGLEVSAAGAPGHGVTQDFREFSDTFLTLAALAPLLPGPTRITGIAHTRKQETDRVAGMAQELRRLGQEIVEEEDALTITPRPLPSEGTVETYGDHRFAMSFAILGCHDRRGDGRPWLAIRNPACCAKTFPEFFAVLDDLRRASAGTAA
ncbi:MAG TPA: 3-phosphoshikimate 1-carboxyvinyltransferase [Opitutaceae bacterium]|nr:3-phosphoshikimate 1-carboxyvinyltransferase [Opitutaceae bacterium]